MRKVCSALAAVAMVLVASVSAEAQRFGGQIVFADDVELGVGARLEVDMPGKLSKTEPFSRAFFIGQFDLFLDPCDPFDCTYWEINPALAVPFRANSLRPYAGAGLNIAHASNGNSNTEIGVNILGGLKFALSTIDGFAEARLSLGGGEQFAVMFGLLFGDTGEAARPRPARR